MENKQPVTYIGFTNWRNKNIHFGIKDVDRMQHIYSIGRTGMGKTYLLVRVAKQDIANGHGVAILDPHGDAAQELVSSVPTERLKDLVYLDAGAAQPLVFNPLHNHTEQDRHLLASEIVSIFRKNWMDSWGVNMAFILRHCILALLEYPGTTLLDIEPFLTHKAFRHAILKKATDKNTLHYWVGIFDKYSPSQQQSAIAPILNKAGTFSSNAVIKKIVGKRAGSISIPDIVDNGKILIVNLSKGVIGEQACALLGSMITTSIQMAAMRKARLEESNRRPFYLFLDEAHSFLTPSFAQMLSECRKYKLGLFLTHQYLDQLTEDTRNAILGNVGTMIAFRLGTKDARIFKEEMYPTFEVTDFINLPRYYFYIKLLIDGVASKAFSAVSGEP